METKTRFINNLLIHNKVSLKMVYDNISKNKEYIENITNIFDLKDTDDFLLCQTAIKILSNEKTKQFIDYFRNDTGKSDYLDDSFFENNKTLILTAFIYNSRFYAMMRNMHGIIAYELQKQEKAPIKHSRLQSLKNRRYGYVFRNQPKRHLEYKAASGSGPQLRLVMKYEEKIEHKGIKGGLSIYGNDQNHTIQFQFEFEEIHKNPPYFLEIEYITEADNKTNSIKIDIKRDELTIVSEVQNNIDFTKGITITEIKGLKSK